ncbi:MAG TPA: hypothetical protein VFF75_04550 [Methylophilaceae bacterium]|nr:hypothetical protein [Methylophilaceae bacterium]
MAHFLRDEFLSNLTLTEDRLSQLNTVIKGRLSSMPESFDQNHTDDPNVLMFYVIRFDGKGHRVFSFEDLITYFRQADYVERVSYVIESSRSLGSSRNVGSFAELRLDNREPNNSFIQVSSDDGDWVESTFASVKDVLRRCRNHNGWINGIWAQLAIQLSGVFIGFLFSLWAAVAISPYLAIDNSFLITFLFALLVFSNLWTFLNQLILHLVRRVFPNVRFYRPDRDRLHWLMQALIGGIVVAVFLFLLDLLFGYVGRVLSTFF